MITIGKPYIEIIDDKFFLKSHIVDECQGIEDDMYFMSDLEYGHYFCDDVADSFVIAMLQQAVKYGQDITVEAKVSERLLYNIENSLIYTIGLSWGTDTYPDGTKKSNIKVITRGTCIMDYKPFAVGCGCSLGVDSFATLLQHMKPCDSYDVHAYRDAGMSSYDITHLTYFNVGAMGYTNLDKARLSYLKDLEMVRKFAEEQKLPVVCIESNISKWHQDFDFDESGHIRNYATILSMQKLFRRYLYASSFPLKDFQFTTGDSMGYWESLAMSLMSTENTELIVANPNMSRVDKTKYIIDNQLTQKYLYVCWKELIANKWPDSDVAKIKDLHLNCSRCDKCKRTLLAIDLLGKLDKYEEIFDIPYWKKTKDKYIINVLLNKDNNTFYHELCDLMDEVGYTPSEYVKKELKMIKIRKTLPYRAIMKIKRIIKL